MGILWRLVALAAGDSVNPCTFYIFATLLLAVSLRYRSPRRTGLVAAFFIAGVYAGYYMLGVGLAVAGTYIPRTVLLAIALTYGGVVIVNSASELLWGKPLTPKPAKLLSAKTVRAVDYAAAAALGLTLAFTLLPCSGGPLVAFIAIASSQGYSLASIALLLTLYDLIFVAPLVAIAVTFTTAKRLVAARIPPRIQSILSLTAGILIIVVVLVSV